MGTVTIETHLEAVTNSNESQRNSEMNDKRKRKRERKKKRLEEHGNALKNNNCHVASQKEFTECHSSQGDEITEDAGKAANEDHVYHIEKINSNCTVQAESSHQTCVCPHEEAGASQTYIDSIFPENSQNDADMLSSTIGKSKRSRKKKEKNNALEDNSDDFHSTDAGVVPKCDAMHVSEAKGSTLMNMAEQSAIRAGDDSVMQRVETDVMADPTTSKTRTLKSKKRKRNKAKTMEVGNPSGNTLAATKDSELVQSSLKHSNVEDGGKNHRDGVQEFVCKEFRNKMEKSATSEKSGVQSPRRVNLENDKDECTKVNQDVVGAEGACTPGGKKRKKKTSKMKKACADHGIANVESIVEVKVKTNGESICGNSSVKDEEREINSSLSSYVRQDNVALGVVSGDTRENLPRCTCLGHPSRKLLVLDLNGILADVVRDYHGKITPDGKVSGRSVFRRPFLANFLEFCFERFDVGIWSSRHIGLFTMINIVMRSYADRMLFCLDSNACTQTKFKTLENGKKPLVLKDLRRVWDCFGTCQSCGMRKYDETNTLLVDDSPYKALCNPPNTGIFPHSYQYTDHQDSTLGPSGDLRLYLGRLADAENVQKFVEENPFGEPAISESHESWEFYSKVIQESHLSKSTSHTN